MQISGADIRNMEREYRRNMVNTLSGFKSVNLCGTVTKEGSTNLSVISSVVNIGANPPLMGMILRPPLVPRHTLENILETGYFSLNHIQEPFLKQAHQTAARYDSRQSEFEESGLEAFHTDALPAPYVKESLLKIGLVFKERIDIKINGTVFIIGEVIEIMLPDEAVKEDGFIDLEAIGSLTVSGLDSYHETKKVARFTYPKPGQELKEF